MDPKTEKHCPVSCEAGQTGKTYFRKKRFNLFVKQKFVEKMKRKHAQKRGYNKPLKSNNI